MQTFFTFTFTATSKLVTTFQRRNCGSIKKKVNVGLIVKHLNKENKSLFGNLLETRSDRRKVIKKVSRNIADDFINRDLPLKKEETRKKSDLTSKYSPPELNQGKVEGNCIGQFENTLSQECDTVPSVDDAVAVPARRNSGSAAVFPAVVLKNIQGFPLINRNKYVSGAYSLENPEILVSRSRGYSKLYPSVSKILNSTMSDVSKALLKKWREKMISELGEEGFLKFYKAQLNAGIQFHAAVQSFLRGVSEESLVLDGRGVAGCWKSLSSVITSIDNIRVLEGPVCHSHLFYHGVMDCIASYQGEKLVIEWKKSDKPKPTLEKTYDAPVQLSAYIGAMNYDQSYPLQVKGGMVVVAYSDGSPADVFHLTLPECNKFWSIWLDRVQSFWSQQHQDPTLTPASQNKEL